MQEKSVLQVLTCENWDGPCESSRLLVVVDQQELVHTVSYKVEDEANEVKDRHSTRVHLNDEQANVNTR